MKPLVFKNLISHERWLCDNPKQVKVIEGVEYILVRKPESQRTVLMRKDSLLLDKK